MFYVTNRLEKSRFHKFHIILAYDCCYGVVSIYDKYIIMELNTLYSNETYLNYTNERSNDSNIYYLLSERNERIIYICFNIYK